MTLEKILILYILLSCFETLQLCEPKLKQLMGVPKRVLYSKTMKIDQSIKLFYWFPLNSITSLVLPGFSCKQQDATNSTLYIQASFVNTIATDGIFIYRIAESQNNFSHKEPFKATWCNHLFKLGANMKFNPLAQGLIQPSFEYSTASLLPIHLFFRLHCASLLPSFHILYLIQTDTNTFYTLNWCTTACQSLTKCMKPPTQYHRLALL